MAAECSSVSCRAAIDWAVYTKKNGSESRHPVDHGSAGAEGGKLAVWRNGFGELCCRFLTKARPLDPDAGEILGTSHYQTCPDRDRFRRTG